MPLCLIKRTMTIIHHRARLLPAIHLALTKQRVQHQAIREPLLWMRPALRPTSDIHRIFLFSMKPEKSWKPLSTGSAKPMRFLFQGVTPGKQEKIILPTQNAGDILQNRREKRLKGNFPTCDGIWDTWISSCQKDMLQQRRRFHYF